MQVRRPIAASGGAAAPDLWNLVVGLPAAAVEALRILPHSRSQKAISPMGLQPPSGLPRNTMSVVSSPDGLGSRSQAVSICATLSAKGLPSLSSKRGWEASHTKAV